MARGVEKTLEAIGKTRGAYCQIAGAEISAHACLTTQDQPGCFGCASPYRFCELCKDHLVAVAAVGLCSSCLEKEVEKERRTGKPTFLADFKVDCQLLGRSIKPAMCEATQGQEGCRNCTVPSRLCEKCKERPVRFPRYGLCLSCSVEELGGDEDKVQLDEDESRLREIRAKLSPKPGTFLGEAGEAQPLGRNREEDQTRIHGEEKHSQPTEPSKVRTEGGKVIVTLVAKRPDHFSDLVDRAELLVSQRDHVSVLFLKNNLKVNYGIAQKVMSSLEAKGVVGPPNGTKPREVKNPKEVREKMVKTSTQSSSRVVDEKRSKFLTLVDRAKKLVISKGKASALLLQQELAIGFLKANQVLDELESQGVVKPAKVGSRRKALNVSQASSKKSKKKKGSRGKRGKNSTKVTKLLPRTREFIAERERVNIKELAEYLKVNEYYANRVIQLLEEEGLVEPYQGDRKPRKVLRASSPEATTSESRVPHPKSGIKRVEELIRIVGEESELGKVLRSLVRESSELRTIKSQLKGLVTGARSPRTEKV